MISLSAQNWCIENIETILFDKDGTFIDLHYFWGQMTKLRAKEIINFFQLPEDYFKDLCQCLGFDIKTQKMLSDGITALYSRSKIIVIFNNDLKKMGVKTTNQILESIFDNVSNNFYANMTEYTKPINSAIEFIKKLKTKGVKVGVVTSDSVESANLTIKHFRWEELFDVVIGRESCNATKESGKPTKLALDILSANPLTTLMIGDAPMDYISAQNAGITNTILVATGQIERKELEKISTYTVNSLDEITIL